MKTPQAFNIRVKKKTPYERRREAEEARRKREEEEAAKVFEEFARDHAEPVDDSKTFVKGGGSETYSGSSKLKSRKSAASVADVFGSDTTDEVEKPKMSKQRQMSNLERFKLQLKQRHAAKGQGGAGGDGKSSASAEAAATINSAPLTSTSILKGTLPDGPTTNLFIADFGPNISEQELQRSFSPFGPIASVKIMWPRSAEEHASGRFPGFVAFMRREDAEKAMEAMQGKLVAGVEARIGWAKAVPIPPVPLGHGGPPTGLPFNAVRRRTYGNVAPPGAMNAAAEAEAVRDAIIQVMVPYDKEQRQIINRTVEYVLRYGPDFELALMNKVNDDSRFAFLFKSISPEHVYYRWRLYSLLNGDDLYDWSTEPFRMFEGGSKWIPPAPPAEPPTKGRLSLRDRERFSEMMDILISERDLIGDVMYFCLSHAYAADEVIDLIVESLSRIETPVPLKLARLHLVSDILHNSTAPVLNASAFRTGFEPRLKEIFGYLGETHRAILGRLRAEQFRQDVLRCLSAWKTWSLYTPDYFDSLEKAFVTSSRAQRAAPKAESEAEQRQAESEAVAMDVEPTEADLEGEKFDASQLPPHLPWLLAIKGKIDFFDLPAAAPTKSGQTIAVQSSNAATPLTQLST